MMVLHMVDRQSEGGRRSLLFASNGGPSRFSFVFRSRVFCLLFVNFFFFFLLSPWWTGKGRSAGARSSEGHCPVSQDIEYAKCSCLLLAQKASYLDERAPSELEVWMERPDLPGRRRTV